MDVEYFYISINILGDSLLLWGLVGHLWNSAQSLLIFHQGRQDFFGCSAQCPLDDIFSTLVMETNTISSPMQRIRIVSLVLRVSCFLFPPFLLLLPKATFCHSKNPTLGISLCLRLLPMTMINTAQKQLVERRVYFSLQLLSIAK